MPSVSARNTSSCPNAEKCTPSTKTSGDASFVSVGGGGGDGSAHGSTEFCRDTPSLRVDDDAHAFHVASNRSTQGTSSVSATRVATSAYRLVLALRRSSAPSASAPYFSF